MTERSLLSSNKLWISLILATVFSMGNGKKLLISLYYESLCGGCIHFDTEQLYPLYTKIPEYIDLDLIPYGNAKTTKYENGTIKIQCQHGINECRGNTLHACAISKLPPRQAAAFVGCSMGQPSPPDAGPYCAKRLKLDPSVYQGIDDCAGSVEGFKLLYNNGIRTAALTPSHEWVPWVIFDGVYNKDDMDESMKDLQSVVCRLLKGPLPPLCNQVDDFVKTEPVQVCENIV